MTLSIIAIIPAHDEAERLPETLAALSNIPGLMRVIVADDGSRDATAEISHAHGAEVVEAAPSGQPSGKGNALLVGLTVARCFAPEAVLLADADLGASASKLAGLIGALDEQNPVAIAAFPPAKYGGFGLVKALTRRAIARRTGHDLSEPLSGQRALLLSALETLPGMAPGFGAEAGMTLDLLAAGIEPCEVSIPLTHRPTGKTLAGFAHRARQGRDIVQALRGDRHPW